MFFISVSPSSGLDSVSMSVSSVNVRVNGSLNITMLRFDPPCCTGFESLAFLYILDTPNAVERELAAYTRFEKKFDLKDQLPLRFRGRVNISSAHTITISPVTFADEKAKFYFKYKYFSGSGIIVRSDRMGLQDVFGMYFIPLIPMCIVFEILAWQV